jgi:pantoate--beta-alanine ligase
VSPPVVTEAPAELREQLDAWQGEGLRIGLVPTMGNLHAGHLDLVRAAAAQADRVVVSIFVNPLQFGPNEDFASYPRTLAADLAQLATEDCQLVFAPGEDTMYPRGRAGTTRIEVPGLSEVLCGARRPGHFTGVATVVAKLFNLVRPQLAVFGEKDCQQLAVIRRMVTELCFPVEIHGVVTRREADGLAMSSRNRYLDPEQRARAPALFGALRTAAEALAAGGRDFVALQQAGMDNIRSAGLDPEYFEVRRQQELDLPGPGDRRLVILAAARLGRARLIDNVAVEL